jgi:ribosomal-protein-alanine N-acetyltransferase
MIKSINSSIVETERLTLRKFTTEDAPFLCTLMNCETWINHIGDQNIRNVVDAEVYIQKQLMSSYNAYSFGLYLILLKDTLTPLGMCGLVKRESLSEVDLGFALLPEYTGLGYAKEAAQAVLKFAQQKLGLKKVVAITDRKNEPSKKLLAKLEFEFESRIQMDSEELEFYSMIF